MFGASSHFNLADILKKFIKGFDLLLFGRIQHSGRIVDFWQEIY